LRYQCFNQSGTDKKEMCAIAVFACMLALSLHEAKGLAVCRVASCY